MATPMSPCVTPFGAQAANHTLFDTREARFETWTDCVILV